MGRGGEGPVGHPRLFQDLQGAGLQRGGPGLPVRRGLALDHPGPHPMARKLNGGEQARRPRADHQYIGPPGTHYAPLDQGPLHQGGTAPREPGRVEIRHQVPAAAPIVTHTAEYRERDLGSAVSGTRTAG
jgi:hypothetical protein